ncbi:MAG: hypothetical protein VX642_03515 [Bdellovibrionota bacterium]|nr:hypothetical protein [Bdellovibrionota bacterium]
MKSLKQLLLSAIVLLSSTNLFAQAETEEMTKQIEIKLIQATNSYENLKAMAIELNELSEKIIDANLNTGDERALLEISGTIENLGLTGFFSSTGVKTVAIAKNLTADANQIGRLAAYGKGYATPATALASLATYFATKYLTIDEKNKVYNADLKTENYTRDYNNLAQRYVRERSYLNSLVLNINNTTSSKLVSIACLECPEMIVGTEATKLELDFEDIQL